MFALAQSTMSAGVPWHKILPIPRGWPSDKLWLPDQEDIFLLTAPFIEQALDLRNLRYILQFNLIW
jgi:hypothetical protein